MAYNVSRLRFFSENGEDRLSSLATSSALSSARGFELDGYLGRQDFGNSEIAIYGERSYATDKAANPFSVPSSFTGVSLSGTFVNVPAEVLIDDTIGGGEIDFFSFNLVAGETYVFSVFGSGANPLLDTFLYLADADFNLIDFDDDGGSGFNSLLTFTATSTGEFIVGVGAYPGSGLTGDYTLDAVQQPPTDVVSDDPTTATALDIGSVTYGFIDPGPGVIYGPSFGEVDTYSFTVEEGQIYSFEIAGGADYNSDFLDLPPGELDTFVVIYDADFNIIAINDDIDFPGDISSQVSFFATESGTYYIDVFSYAPWTGGYSITSQVFDPADFNPLDAINWASANNIPVDENNTAYIYFAGAGESFGELADDGVSPLPSFGWNEFEIGQVMLALEQYSAITGINYVITDDPTQATFRFITTESDFYGAYMYPQDPDFGTQQGIGAFNILSGGWTFDQQQSLVQGGYAFSVILHELGHGHGLAHPHDNGGGSDIMLGVTGAFGSYGLYDLNQGVYTVMSYNDAWDLHPDGPSPFTADGVDNGWTGTLSAFDIAALQERYGVHAFATGNNVYELRDEQEQGTYYQTIWDTGGTDVIRYTGTRNTRIDLLAATIDYSPTGGGVVSFVDGIWGGYTIAQGVVIENATGGDGDDSLLGNAAANVLTGNGGDDILVGRAGGDTMNGGAGFDVVSYIDAGAGVRASLVANRGYTGDAAGDTFTNVEGLQGSAFNDILDGGNRDDHLDGLGGNDTLTGGNGRDTLLGGAGVDTLDGGNDADILDGGAGNDVLRGGNGADDIVGGDGNDNADGGNDVDEIDGGAGDDTLVGGNGADILIGGDGVDNLNGGNDDDTLHGNAGNDTLVGGNGRDTMLGGADNDSLDGGNDNDTLDGGSGNDTLIGGNGNDTFIGGSGNDVATGGNGNDIYVFSTGSGLDTITDFRRGQDRIDVTATDLLFSDLDSNGNGVLDNADDFVTVGGGTTVLDLGAALGGAAGLNTLTLNGVTGLTGSDFWFGP